MVSHMKTTIQLPNALLSEAKSVAKSRNTTLKGIIEEGLRRFLRELRLAKSSDRPVLEDGSYGDPKADAVSLPVWERQRELIYGPPE